MRSPSPEHDSQVTAPPPTAPLTIASVPSGHVYVRHLTPEHGGGPVRLPDPDPTDPTRVATGAWWPPAMLEPQWVLDHPVDLMHLHFGFDARTPEQLQAWLDALEHTDTPLVQTVHDLRNPHHTSRDLHDRQLDVLIPAAAQLITLTDGAAGEIERRWGRRAAVVPHPHVVDLATMAVAEAARARRHAGPFRVGLHVKSLRASMDPLALLPTLVEAVAALPDAVLQVNAHRDVLADGGAKRDAGLATFLRFAASRGLLELHVHDYLSDQALFEYLNSLDVSVLPYRFGTHSGWLEACRDLGTTVIAPSCGFYTEQGPVLTYGHDERHLDNASLARAIRFAHAERPRFGASIDERRRQRVEIAAAHDTVYAAALGSALGRRSTREGAGCASA